MNNKTHPITTYWGSVITIMKCILKIVISQVYVFDSKYITIFIEMYMNLSHAQDLEQIFSLNTVM